MRRWWTLTWFILSLAAGSPAHAADPAWDPDAEGVFHRATGITVAPWQCQQDGHWRFIWAGGDAGSMTNRDLGAYALETAASRLLLSHWLDARGDAPMPTRASIDPGMLKMALPQIFMLNMVDRETATYRLVGTAHRARWGIEFTGHVWGKFLDDTQRIERTQRLWRTFEQPCGFVARYEVVFASGARDPVETLLLPLRPNQPAGYPILIGVSISTRQVEWVNQPGSVASRTAERFRYLDLGSGVPSD